MNMIDSITNLEFDEDRMLFHPLTVGIFACIGIQHLGCLSNTCVYWLCILLFYSMALATLQINMMEVTSWYAPMVKLMLAGVIAIHFPMKPKRVSLFL